VVVGSISKSRVSWKFQTTPLQIWFTGPVESIFLGKHHFYQPTYAVKWDLKICINLQKYYERSWFHRDFGSKAKFTVRVSCKMSLSLVTVGAKLMYIYHTLDALVMITPFQSPALWWSSGRDLIRSGRSQLVLGSGMSSPPFRPPG
jgi:hypothetical protein